MKHTFFCIDAHTCGNPVRLVAGGAPRLNGSSIRDKWLEFQREYDWIRRGLMFEPRGHDMMSGSILYPPEDPQMDAAILFIETSGCLPMCGHGTIGTLTIALEEGLIQPKTPGTLNLEVPAGRIQASYVLEHGKVRSVRFLNVGSFLEAADLPVECPELGPLRVDVAYGGNFYAIVDIQSNYPGLDQLRSEQLTAWSRILRQQLNERYRFVHPIHPDIHGLSHILWAGRPSSPEVSARNAVFYGDKAIDRSPCGTGTSARMAQWFAQGKLGIQQPFVHESIIGSRFVGRVEAICQVGDKPAILPSIEGWAKVYGYNTLRIDAEDDPFAFGFQVI